MSDLRIRPVEPQDEDAVWAIFEPIVAAGETYAFPRDTDRAGFRRLWLEAPQATLVAEAEQQVLGTYYIKPNAGGPGAHVCNCGYMTAPEARGRGVARAMCRHSIELARELGFLAMQYNSVVATNAGAIALWHSEGFETVGRLPRAFRHPAEGLVDCLVMYRWLGD